MFVRKSTIKTLDEYIKNLEYKKENTTSSIKESQYECLIASAKYYKKQSEEYVYVPSGGK